MKRRGLIRGIIFCLFVFFYLSPLVYAQSMDQQFQGFNLQGFNDDGTKSWEVNGDTADILAQEIKINNVNVDIYGQQKINIKGNTGMVNQTAGTLRLQDNVVITAEKGTQLITDYLDWDRNQDTVSTQDNVVIMDKKFTLKGVGLEAHPNLKTVQVLKDVVIRANTEPEGKEPKYMLVTSDGSLSIDQTKSLAVLENNVFAVQEGRTLKADRMELYFNRDTNQIKEVICLGHVEITQGENKSLAQKAVYRGFDQKLVLLGRPKIVMLTEEGKENAAFGN